MKSFGRTWIVVGDMYRAFAKREGILQESEVIARLLDPSFDCDSMILGQGLCTESVARLLDMAKSRGITCVPEDLKLAETELTHKAENKNVLISSPRRSEGRAYRFWLMVGNQSDRLSDHVTGEHIGAMLLIEAARQGGIATLELEFPMSSDDSCGYVLQSFNTSYSQYAFPIPTELVVEVDRDSPVNRHQRTVSLSARFYQNSKCIAEIEMNLQMINKRMLCRIENKKAQEACLASLLPVAVAREDVLEEVRC